MMREVRRHLAQRLVKAVVDVGQVFTEIGIPDRPRTLHQVQVRVDHEVIEVRLFEVADPFFDPKAIVEHDGDVG